MGMVFRLDESTLPEGESCCSLGEVVDSQGFLFYGSC